MNWLQEIRATRLTLEEVGLLALIRLQFKNRYSVHVRDIKEVLGEKYESLLGGLCRKGILHIERTTYWIILSVRCPGDKERARKRIWSNKHKGKIES